MKMKPILYLLLGASSFSLDASAENYQCYVFCSDNQHHIVYESAPSLAEVKAKVNVSQRIDSNGRALDILQVKECKTEHAQFVLPDAEKLLESEPG